MAQVTTASGYSYFGSSPLGLILLAARPAAALTSSPRSGALMSTTSPPMSVTKAVRTTAPFS